MLGRCARSATAPAAAEGPARPGAGPGAERRPEGGSAGEHAGSLQAVGFARPGRATTRTGRRRPSPLPPRARSEGEAGAELRGPRAAGAGRPIADADVVVVLGAELQGDRCPAAATPHRQPAPPTSTAPGTSAPPTSGQPDRGPCDRLRALSSRHRCGRVSRRGRYDLARCDILVTGAAGFIGSNFVRHWVERASRRPRRRARPAHLRGQPRQPRRRRRPHHVRRGRHRRPDSRRLLGAARDRRRS